MNIDATQYMIHKNLIDGIGIKDDRDHFNIKTKVVVRCSETKEEIFTARNKLILPGAGFIARSLFDFSSSSEITPTYNSALGLDNIAYSTTPGLNKIYLFCVGTDGCGTQNSQVYEEDYRKWIGVDSIIPFQYRPVAKDLSDSARKELYFGRKTSASYYSYYFKKFDSDPRLIQQFSDGTPIDSNIYNSTSTLPVQTIAQMQMSVTPYDCRDYFIATTGVNDARINTISLCTAWAKEINGYSVYQDIRPVTKLNFPNEALIDLKKGIDIDYSIYF